MDISLARKLREQRKLLKLTAFQAQIIIGSILGDGSLRLMGQSKEASFVVDHSGRQKDYVLWKHNALREWVNYEPRTLQRIYHKDKSRFLISVRFQTINHPEFTFWYKVFYQNGKKVIPDNISKTLTSPLSLAIWFMDDGNKNHGAVFLNTQQFERYEQERLIGCLKNNFGLECTLNKHSIWNGRQLFRIRVGTKSTKVLSSLISSYLLPSMQYKIPFFPVTTSLQAAER